MKILIKSTLYIICILNILFIYQCSNSKFDLTKWNERVDGFYVNRKYLVHDLLENHLRIGTKVEDIRNLFESKENCEINLELAFCFEIEINYGWDIDPKNVKSLILEFDDDKKLSNIEFQE